MRIGYARVSTQDQKLELQIDALKTAGCEIIFKEKISGKSQERPELQKLFEKIRKGDELVVWKLDRLGRSLRNLIDIITRLNELEVTFVSLNDSINTGTATGRFTFNLFASLAEFEREMIRERTNAGLTAARARGRKGGRPSGYSQKTISLAYSIKILFDQKKKTMDEIAQNFRISRSTAYRYLGMAQKIAEEEAKNLSIAQ